VSCVMLDHCCQGQRHPLAERGDDLYETPSVAIDALLRVERIPHCVWEPACGPGAIVRPLRTAGHDVLASDLIDYGDPSAFYRRDFLIERMPPGYECILTTPPLQVGRGVRRARNRHVSARDDAAALHFL